MSYDDLTPEHLTDDEVLQYAELNDNRWVKRLLGIIHDLQEEVAYIKEDSTRYDDDEEREPYS